MPKPAPSIEIGMAPGASRAGAPAADPRGTATDRSLAIIDLVLSTPGLSDDDRIAILGVTAQKLMGIEP